MSNAIEPIRINGMDHELRYPIKEVIAMLKTGGEVVGIKRRLIIDEVTAFCSDPEFLINAFWHGLKHENDKITVVEAEALFEAYMDDGEPDEGGDNGRYQGFINLVQTAINLRFNVDLKNARARAKAEREKEEEERRAKEKEMVKDTVREMVKTEMDARGLIGSKNTIVLP